MHQSRPSTDQLRSPLALTNTSNHPSTNEHSPNIFNDSSLRPPSHPRLFSEQLVRLFMERMPACPLYASLLEALKNKSFPNWEQDKHAKVNLPPITTSDPELAWQQFLYYVGRELDPSLAHYYNFVSLGAKSYSSDPNLYSETIKSRQGTGFNLKHCKSIRVIAEVLMAVLDTIPALAASTIAYTGTKILSYFIPNSFTDSLPLLSLAFGGLSLLARLVEARDNVKKHPIYGGINIESNHFLQLTDYNHSTSIKDTLSHMRQLELESHDKDNLMESFLIARMLRMFGVDPEIFTNPSNFRPYFADVDLRTIKIAKRSVETETDLQQLLVQHFELWNLPIPRNLRNLFLDQDSDNADLINFLETGNCVLLKLLASNRSKAEHKFIELFCSK